jgi:hypothetical protein
MLSVSVVELHVRPTVSYMKMLSVAQRCFCGKFIKLT